MAKIRRKPVKKNEVMYETKIPQMGQREKEMLKEALKLLRQNENYILGCYGRRRGG